jgi:enoyl-CoA hydratase/carnithine racemase
MRFDGLTAEHYGIVNRAVPDRELDAFVDDLAQRIAGYDQRTLAHAKALIDHVSLPQDGDLVVENQEFLSSAALLH